jgi:methyltransferase (TIGR00027 family)
MAKISNVSATAFIVAELRAEESREAAPLYRDDIVQIFLDAETREAAHQFEAVLSGIASPVKVRTRYFDDQLDEQLRKGVRQIVIPGAGLDTRSLRKQTPGVTYFEIDDPHTLELKKARLEAHHLRPSAKFIAGDYVRDDLIALLAGAGFDFTQSAHFLWEGNTMYLPGDSVRLLMKSIATHIVRPTLSFDYVMPEIIAQSTGKAVLTELVEQFRVRGAPWVFGIGDLAALTREVGFSIVDHWKSADLFRAYRPGRPLDWPLHDYYCLCTLEAAR